MGNVPWTHASFGAWDRAMLPGHYISKDGKYTAEVQPAGKYDGNKLVRHYAIRHRGQSAVIARYPTLKDAARRLGL